MPPRRFPIAAAGRRAYDEFLADLAGSLADPRVDRNELARDTLLAWTYPGLDGEEVLADPTARPALKAAVASCDPRNITLEPEYYLELDPERYYPRKPLIWLWMCFDRGAFGQNVRFGTELRALLAQFVFGRCGERVRIFQDVQVSFGYNLTVGDDVILHRNVLLDDRGEIVIEDGVSISDYVNVYSHSHDIHDIHDVRVDRTVIRTGTRLTYHSTVLSGVTMGRQSMLATGGVAHRDVGDFTLAGGLPARPLRVKDTAPFDHPLKKG
jgi:acetyltransferase-like isoleucine patch superfamily enzyme